MINKRLQKKQRHIRSRRKITGTDSVPRLSIFRSSKHIYAQIVDDTGKKTLVSSSDIKQKDKPKDGKGTTKVKIAFAVGEDIAAKANAKKIKKVVFDTGGNKYHGRVKALAEGARKGGLIF